MSCSSPIYTYTNAKYLYRGVSRFSQVYACGKCSGCISRHRSDWRVRSYYEAKDCLNSSQHSFCLFDTLTYSDDYIRKYSYVFPELEISSDLDHACFSRYDVQTFFKRLRVNLSRAGYFPEDGALRYILTCEYGSAEKTRGFMNTHRPHYHILFFVRMPISPVDFSRFVSQSWFEGKTDGVRPYDDCSKCPVRKFCNGYCIYQSKDYVLRERVISNDSKFNTMKCVNYVTKYISKDMYITKKLEDKVRDFFDVRFPDYETNLETRRFYRKFCSQVLPFHLQSLGFGASVLDDPKERDFIIRENKIHLPTSDSSVVASVAVPRYFDRKLFYDYKKVDGRVVWSLSDFGIRTKQAHLEHRIRQFMSEFRAYDPKFPSKRLYDLALYRCVYKGTLSDYYSLSLPYWVYYLKTIRPHAADERPLYYNRGTIQDKLTVGKFISSSYKVTSDGEIIYNGKQLHKEFIPYDGYYLVNDKLKRSWYGFDKILARFNKWRCDIVAVKDVIQMNDDFQLDRYKQFGMVI